MSLDAYKARIKRLLAKRGSSLAEIDRSPFRSVSASETPCSRHVSLDSCYGCGGTIQAGLSVSGSVRCHDCRAAA